MLKQVLVIEDDEALRRLFQTVLNYKNCEVVLAETRAEAWEQLNRQTFDFVMADVLVDDGTTLDIIKACYITRQPIVAISSNDEYISACREMGATAFLLKPVGVESIMNIVETIDQIQTYQVSRLL